MVSFRSSLIPVLLGLAALAASPMSAHAQFTSFGKNKVQYNDFEWHVLRDDHFDLYFYPEEEELARRSLEWAEESYAILAARFGHEVRRRIPLIVYSTHHSFQQTNVTPFFLPEGVAGLTEFVKGRVLMPFNGSYSQFRETLHHELVHVFQLSLIATTYRKHFRHDLAPVPLWFSEGMADYLAEEWDPVGDMLLADFVVEGRLPDIDDLWRYNGTFTLYKLGQRLTGFLAEEYGDDIFIRVYESLWVSPEFGRVLEYATGVELSELNARWHQRERRHYYPRVQERETIPLTARRLTRKGVSFKPTPIPDGILGEDRFLFSSPRSGYTNIYVASTTGIEKDVEIVVKGEREARLESLHPFVSKLDVTADGRLAFVSKWHDRDALLVRDLARDESVGSYQFPGIVGLSSPAWSDDGRALVFEGLSHDAYSDLYLFELETNRLTRLTHDLYEDLDPDFVPGQDLVVFASDRTESGESGHKNLFLLDLDTREIRYLTRGPWVDSAPRAAPDGERVYFTSSRSGTPDLYQVDLQGNGSRLTWFLSGALDPSPMPDGDSILFTGYSRGTYHTYAMDVTEGREPFSLGEAPVTAGWWWPDPGEKGKAEAARYERVFGLDFAAGGVIFDPVQSDAGGATLTFTDMLGDEVIVAQVGNTSDAGSSFLERMNVGLTYLNLRRRINYGVSAFHFAGDYRDERDFIFFERRAGLSAVASYPFSKFRRVETSLGILHSDKRNRATGVDRRAWVASNFVSWVHDNSLWLPTGPVDGTRMKTTLGLTIDIPRADVENVQLLGDFRRYFRTGLRSTWATRLMGRISEGSDPRYWTLGGTHTLRGYPRRDLFGTRAVLLNNEYRFPLLNGFAIGFPFGTVEFPGVEGAFFVDAGWLWTDDDRFEWRPLGSTGLSFRMGFGGFLVFRFDLARRTDFETLEKKTRSEFFIGWDY